MFTYLIKRLIPTLFGITIITFILLKCIPGDPIYSLVGERASEETIERYRSQFGIGRYTDYIKMILSGNLGYSYYTKEAVWDTFCKKFPNTLVLTLLAMLIAVSCGISLGIISSIKQNTYIDRIILFGTTLGISLPVFWWGMILIIIFAYILKLGISSLILASITLGSRSIAYLARVTRTSMLEILSKPYIISAKAMGVSKWKLVMKYGFRNALIPVVTMAALDIGSYLNGAVLTETIFNWDGIGRWAVTAIFKRDYPVILAIVLWGAVIFVIINFLVDIAYQFINPKMRI